MDTPEPGPVLAIAAMTAEFVGLRRRASAFRRLPAPISFLAEATIAGQNFILAAAGPGPRLATRATLHALSLSRPSAICSLGLCGALHPNLNACDIVVATEIISPHQGPAWPALQPTTTHQHTSGPILSHDRVAVTAADKARLLTSGAIAVEMEAAAVAVEAHNAHLPFYCIRVISDDAHSSLPLDFNKYRRSSGHFSAPRIALASLLHPSAIAPLARLAAASRRASFSLGDFLANCHFNPR